MNQPTDTSSFPPVPRSFWHTGMLPGWFPPLFFLLLASLFLWRSTFAGEVFLPANLLGHVAPWSSTIKSDAIPPWNPLRWDGIAQFYPWRHFAHDTIRAGTLPLWNPYQFCGTPFVANSQSAVFYPGNVLFYLLPTDRAFGASALLHLTLCGWFTYLLLRRLGCHEMSALLGGIVYTFSAWQVNWLQLPTFLATSCWFPLLLDQIYALSKSKHKNYVKRLILIAACSGALLLAGHLQIAFYGLLTATLWAVCLLIVRAQHYGIAYGLRFLALCLAGLFLGILLALPQILPALELSGLSHRQGKPSQAGYKLYVEYALPAGNLAMLTVPEFFGTDTDPGNPYYGFYVKQTPGSQAFAIRHNAAETAVYVGIVPLLLASLAITVQFTRRRSIVEEPLNKIEKVNVKEKVKGSSKDNPQLNLRVLFFSGLALMALLLALGTPLNTLFYFLIPGFAQSGSPARCLVLWALALAALSAFGLDALLRQPPTRREAGTVIGSLLILFVIGLSLASQALSANIYFPPILKIPVLGEVLGRIGAGWIRTLVILMGGVFLLFAPRRSKPAPVSLEQAEEKSEEVAFSASDLFTARERPFPLIALAALGLVIADLFFTGINVSQTAPAASVYPVTAGIQYLQEHSGHDRVVPINKFWSLTSAPAAVFPPNAAMVYSLRDAQGYDSLLTGQYKRFADTLARPPSSNEDGSLNAAPAAVGNMIFIQNPLTPLLAETGAVFAVTLSPDTPDFAKASVAIPANAVYNASKEMAIYPLSSAKPRAYLQSADGVVLSPSVIYRQDDPTRVSLEFNAPAPASLILADQFYPGWQAQIDGKTIFIEVSGTPAGDKGIFRAVTVPAGPHTVSFRYMPASFRIGFYSACLALGILACLLISSFLPSRLFIRQHRLSNPN